MKGKVARAIRREMAKYKEKPGNPLVVDTKETITTKVGPEDSDVVVQEVPVNHVRRAKKEVKRQGQLVGGIASYGAGLVAQISKRRSDETENS